MAISFAKITRSKPFKFVVGPDKCEFFIHTALLEHYSKPLNTLVDGPMKEAREQSAHLEEVQPETFIRFVEFLYTGSYSPASHSVVVESKNIEPGGDRPTKKLKTAWSKYCQVTPIAKISNESKNESNKKAPVALNPTLSINQPRQWRKFKSVSAKPHERPVHDLRHNEEPCEDYTEVFLSHAKLYVFADTYDVERLSTHVLSKLREALIGFKLYQERVSDVVRLLTFAYESTPVYKYRIDSMRKLVIDYVASHIEHFNQNQSFRALIEQKNTISLDVMDALIKS